jgi:hypothetical protein
MLNIKFIFHNLNALSSESLKHSRVEIKKWTSLLVNDNYSFMSKNLNCSAIQKQFFEIDQIRYSVEASCYKPQAAGSIPNEVIGFFN